MNTPTIAYQLQVSRYATVGGLAILTWDILDNILEDYRLLFKRPRKSSTPAIIYITSRISAFAYALTSTVFKTAPQVDPGHCAILDLIALSWCPISFGATSLLLFLRLRAIHNRNRIVVSIFFILWLALLVGAALAPVSTKGGPVIGPGNIPTGYCQEISITALSYYGIMSPLAYDTPVLLAISWRLSKSYEPGVNVGRRVNAMFFGKDLQTVARSLLIDGQIYYLITVITGVACAVLISSPFVPGPLRDMLEVVYPVVVNIMACRLFRRTKSGAIRESEISSGAVSQKAYLPTIQFAVSHGSDSSTETTSDEVAHVA